MSRSRHSQATYSALSWKHRTTSFSTQQQAICNKMQLNFSQTICLLLISGLLTLSHCLPTKEPPHTRHIPRQSVKTPLGLDVEDLDLSDISPIEDGWLELDSDDGDGNALGSSSVSNANGYLGSIGSGQAAQNGDSLEGSSVACSKRHILLIIPSPA